LRANWLQAVIAVITSPQLAAETSRKTSFFIGAHPKSYKKFLKNTQKIKTERKM
jgi:hypothetical protein